MKIVFFGTPDFVISLPEALLKEGFNLVACVTAPDKPVGRKKFLTSSPVKVWAQKKGILVIDNPSMELITQEIKKLAPNLGILASYGKIIPKSLIDLFPKGILVIHPSLLPKYRGASPVQAAIMAGETETGVSIIKMDEKMDHGPIVAQFKTPLPPDSTPDKLYPQLFAKAAKVLTTILPAYVEGRIKPRQQDHKKATFCKILKKEDGRVDWSKKPEEIERFIRAMTPWPGAWTLLRPSARLGASKGQAKRLKILKAHLEAGKLVFDQVQLEGKKSVSWEEFKRGYPEAKFVS